MNKEFDDGGFAFPSRCTSDGCFPTMGMTLRQWYAGLAMQGLIESIDRSEAAEFAQFKPTPQYKASIIASQALLCADALIKAEKESRS